MKKLLLLSVVLISGCAGSREIFPLSVIPGGISSAEEMNLQNDPVVKTAIQEMGRLHNDPDLINNLEGMIVDHSRMMYTQLRKEGNVYWSRNPVEITQGEMILVHKKSRKWVFRGRCGNGLKEMDWEYIVPNPIVPSVSVPKAPSVVCPPETPTVPEPAESLLLVLSLPLVLWGARKARKP